MVIFLCGFMGCGKSTVGRELSKLMGGKFIDMDTYIENKEQLSIPEIFSQKGEPYFRKIEAETVIELSKTNSIVGCGGGAMLNSASAEIGRKSGLVIFLDVPFATCYDRIKNDSNRPIVMNNSKEQLENIFNERHSIYQKNSSFKVDIDSNVSPFENARTINSLVKLLCK